MALPADYTRCMGLRPECPQRNDCARLRDIPDSYVISWVHNMNPDHSQPCPCFIPWKP
jgi:hypothetical protein